MTIQPSVFLLDGTTALVTGAAQGIGEAIALGLAAFGADLVLVDRDADGLAATAADAGALGAAVGQHVLDVRDDAALASMIAAVGDEPGRVHILVNNVGGGFMAPFTDLSANAEDALIRENFTSLAHVTRQILPLMPDGGSIINVTSIEAHRAAPGFSIYAAMKAAVAELTMSLALELGGRRIRVNCIAPDVIPTPGIGGPFGARTPLPIDGHPDDVAGAAIYLAGAASRFVTGSTIHVDGGNRAAGGWRRSPDDLDAYTT